MTEGNRPEERDKEMPESNFSLSLVSFVVALSPFAVAILAAESIGLTPFDFSGTLVAIFCVSSLFGFIGHILVLHLNRSSLELMS